MLRTLGIGVGLVLVTAVLVATVWVERESAYIHETLSDGGVLRALVLYHPSRDAGFSDQLSIALAGGFQSAGLSVDRATITTETPARPTGYEVVAVVSNTYFWTPDRPTRRYLRRARLDGIPVVGIMAGAGSTARAERILAERLREAGADLLATRSFWTLRPNDESRMDEPNREVAADLAREFGTEMGLGL